MYYTSSILYLTKGKIFSDEYSILVNSLEVNAFLYYMLSRKILKSFWIVKHSDDGLNEGLHIHFRFQFYSIFHYFKYRRFFYDLNFTEFKKFRHYWWFAKRMADEIFNTNNYFDLDKHFCLINPIEVYDDELPF